MGLKNEAKSSEGFKTQIDLYSSEASGLCIDLMLDSVVIKQKQDQRTLILPYAKIDMIIDRVDNQGAKFLQINLNENIKLLLTNQLVGFKPSPISGLDLQKLPQVVTTPDLISVLDALQESLESGIKSIKEAEMLKKAYFSILEGAQKVGFSMKSEYEWISRLIASSERGEV